MKPSFRKLYPGKKYDIAFPFENEESDVEIPKDTIQKIAIVTIFSWICSAPSAW